MKAVEIKKQLHLQIDQIQDEDFLLALNDLMKSQLGNVVAYQLSPAQLAAIEEGRAEHRAGLGIPHEQAMEEIDAWLRDA